MLSVFELESESGFEVRLRLLDLAFISAILDVSRTAKNLRQFFDLRGGHGRSSKVMALKKESG